MNNYGPFENLHFERRPRKINRRFVAITLMVILFTFLWLFVPPDILYWLLLIPIISIVWAASYGWRRALTNLIDQLHRLEQK
jgi:hypothetical protein